MFKEKFANVSTHVVKHHVSAGTGRPFYVNNYLLEGYVILYYFYFKEWRIKTEARTS